MDDFLYQLLLMVMSAVLGGVAGAIIPKWMFGEEQKMVVDKQLNFNQIHLQQSVIIQQRKETRIVVNQRSKGNSDSGAEIIVMYALGAVLLAYGFLKFEANIKMTMAIVTVLLEAIFWVAAHLIIKRNMVDGKIKGILLFNILSAIYIPIIIYLLGDPIIVKNIDKAEILIKMQQEGPISILFEPEKFVFVLYQAIGVFIVFAYMLVVLLGTIHLLAMLNLALEGRGRRFFGLVYRKTYWIGKSFAWYLTFNIILLVISTIFVLGIPTLLF